MHIVEEAFALNEVDAKLIRSFGRVLDSTMGIAAQLRDVECAKQIICCLERNQNVYDKESIILKNFARFKAAFHGDEEIERILELPHIKKLGSNDLVLGPEAYENIGEERLKGSVKLVVTGLPYGYITDDSGHDWFFHREHLRTRQLWPKLAIGQNVTFAVGSNARGPCAIDVVLEPGPS